MNPTKIVLLGSIPKGDAIRETWIDWKTNYTKKIIKSIPHVIFLDGDLISDNVGPKLVVGHDLWLIKHADIVLVHASTKIGAGTAQEMVIAKLFKKPVIAVIPQNTHHRKSGLVFHGVTIADWIHPFLYLSSDFVAETVEEAIVWIKNYLTTPTSREIKDITIFDTAIRDFELELKDVYQKYKKKGW